MTTKFNAYSYFETPIWRQEFPEHVAKTNKVCNKYINMAKKRDKDILLKRNKAYKKNINDFSHEWGLCVPLCELDSSCPILNRGCLLRNDFIPKGIVFGSLRDWIL